MSRSILLRLLFIVPTLLAANFIGFAYTYVARYVQQTQNPFGTGQTVTADILPLYGEYFQKVLRLDFGILPSAVNQTIASTVGEALLKSLGLLGLAFSISLILGLFIGLTAVRVEPPGVRVWLAPTTTTGLALPSFYLGALFIVASVLYTLNSGNKPPLPLSGFGWDLHLIFPVLALLFRPTMQIAQITASLLVAEINKQYVIYARSVGHTWRSVRWHVALRNIIAPTILTAASSLRWLVGELILVEWLFAWPGLGRLLTLTLIPPRHGTPAGVSGGETLYYLDPALIAALLTTFAFVFIVIDLSATALANRADPRLRFAEAEAAKHE